MIVYQTTPDQQCTAAQLNSTMSALTRHNKCRSNIIVLYSTKQPQVTVLVSQTVWRKLVIYIRPKICAFLDALSLHTGTVRISPTCF